jgi:hypothetical protein
MSRSFVLILVPEKIAHDDVHQYVEQIFFPFARENEFPSFTYPCECAGQYERVILANNNIGNFQKFWRSYSLLPQNNRPDWNDYISTWVNAALAPQSELPDPDPGCPICSGLGCFITTTYTHNMYDYWVNVKGEVLGKASQLIPEWTSHDLPNGRKLELFKLRTDSVKPFSFEHFITPDGQPFSHTDFRDIHLWNAAWEKETQNWNRTLVVRCLIHE